MVTSQIRIEVDPKIFPRRYFISADPTSISTAAILGVGTGVALIGMTILGIAIIWAIVKRYRI